MTLKINAHQKSFRKNKRPTKKLISKNERPCYNKRPCSNKRTLLCFEIIKCMGTYSVTYGIYGIKHVSHLNLTSFIR